LILALWLGCDGRTDAQRYRDALAATDWETARADCLRLADPDRSDCLLAVMERLDRLAPEDCALVESPLWRDECTFLYAERAAGAGQLDQAFAACNATGFRRECSYHLIREAARGVLEAPADVAAARIAPYASLPGAPDAPRLFWRAWHRERLARGIAVDPAVCGADTACVQLARETVSTTLAGMAAARGAEAFCADPPTGTDPSGKVVWVAAEPTLGWVRTWVERHCAPPAPPPAGIPAPSTPGGAPVAPPADRPG